MIRRDTITSHIKNLETDVLQLQTWQTIYNGQMVINRLSPSQTAQVSGNFSYARYIEGSATFTSGTGEEIFAEIIPILSSGGVLRADKAAQLFAVREKSNANGSVKYQWQYRVTGLSSSSTITISYYVITNAVSGTLTAPNWSIKY